MKGTTRGLGSVLAPALLLLAGLVFYVHRATAGFTSVPGDLGDPRFNSVILEHLFQWVRGDAASLWTPSFFYPTTGTLAFSDNHFGSGPIYVLLRWFGLSRELAFDGWFAIGFALNFAAMYFVMRRLAFSALPASVAAFIYTFGLPALAQEAHAQLGYRFAIPMAYLYFMQFMRERRMDQLARVAAWGALQFFCSIYLGVFMAYLLAATALAMRLPSLRPLRSTTNAPETTRARTVALFIALACALATAALLLQYHLISRSYGFRPSVSDLISMLPRPQSYLIADAVGAYGWLTNMAQGVPARNEHQLFLGFAPLLLSLWAILMVRSPAIARRRQLLLQCLATLAMLILVTLCIGDLSLYRIAAALPGVSSIRAVTRIVLVMLLPVAVMAAIGVEHLLRLRGVRWFVPGLIVLVLSLETLAFKPTHTPITQWHDRLTPLSAALAGSAVPNDAVLYLSGRAAEPFYLPELDAMMFAQERKMATLNGYSGNAPPGYVPSAPCTTPALRIYALKPTILAKQGITPEALLAKTRWISFDKCPLPYPPVDAAPLPSKEVATHVQLGATVTGEGPTGLQVSVRVRNDGVAALHTLSRIGSPLRFSWRFVPVAGNRPAPDWTNRADSHFSLPPGEQTYIALTIPKPAQAGSYDLQFSIVAEGYEWFHTLGMPVSHTTVVLP
jgi:hypothetical protein